MKLLAVVKNMIVRVGADLSSLVSGFKKGSGATESFAKQTEKALKNSTLSMGNLKKAMAQGGKNAAIVSLIDQIRELEAEQKALKEAGFSWGYEGFEGNEMLLRDLKSQLNDYIRSLEDTGDSTEEVTQKTGRLGAAARSAWGWIKQTVSRTMTLGKESKGSTVGVESLIKSLRRIGLVAVGVRLVKSIFGELQSVVNQYVSQNAALQAQVTALKSSLGQALAPAINLVTNALSGLMPYVVGVSNAIGSLITNLFGSGWTTVADGANEAASAIGGAGSAQKEFNRQLAGFDEITKLNAESGGGGGGGSSSTTTPVEAKTPTWLSSLSEQIKQAASEGDFFGIGAALANAINTGIESINLSDTSLGSKIADLINNGVTGAIGFVETLDWSGLGEAIKKNVSGLLGGIDWAGVFQLGGSLVGGIASALGSALNEAVSGIAQHFDDSIAEAEELGLDIMAGIGIGIGKALANIGSWIMDNIFTPFVEGFKNTFDIHSPSQNEEINSLGENIMLGIFSGITKPLVDATGWVKTNIFEPLSAGFRAVFGKDGYIGSLFAANKDTVSTSVDFQANLTSWKDNLRNKVTDFTARFNEWKDYLRSKTTNFTAKFTDWTDKLKNKTSDFKANLTTWKDKLKDKTLSFKANVSKGWKGSIAEKLGISSITSKLNIKLPKISINWGETTVFSKTFKYPKGFSVKWNAAGAILSGAQLFGRVGNTWLGGGEAGREAVLPLDRNTWWMDKIADRVALRVVTNQAGSQDIVINLVLDGKVITKTVVRNVNAQARATGKHPFASYI